MLGLGRKQVIMRRHGLNLQVIPDLPNLRHTLCNCLQGLLNLTSIMTVQKYAVKRNITTIRMRKRVFRFFGLFIFGVLAVIALSATLIPFIPAKQWYVRIFDYPRLQTFFIAIAALAWYFIFYFKRGRQGYLFVVMFFIV